MRSAAGAVVVDQSGRLAGRGAYVCRTSDCLTIAITKGALNRALHISLPASVLQDLAAGADLTQHRIEGEIIGQE